MADRLSDRGKTKLTPPPAYSQIFKAIANAYHPVQNPNGCIILGVAENTLLHPRLAQFLSEHFKLSPEQLTYGTGSSGTPRFRSILASYLNQTLNPRLLLDKDNIHLSAGASAVVDQLAYCLAGEDEGVLIGKPFYGAFVNDLVLRAGVKAVLVDFPEGVDPLGPECVAHYEEARQKAESEGTKIRALIVCNPHNPLGRCYTPQVLRSLLDWTAEEQLHYISDEIYARSRYFDEPAVEFVSVLELLDEQRVSKGDVHVVYGMSKDFSANGLRLGCVASYNASLITALAPAGMFSWPSAAAEACWSAILTSPSFLSEYFRLNSSALKKHHDLAVDWLERTGVPYIKTDGYGFFIWCDFEAWTKKLAGGEREMTEKMVDSGVYLATGEMFGGQRDGWYRLGFSLERETLEKGLRRLEGVLREAEQGKKPSGEKAPEGEGDERRVTTIQLVVGEEVKL